MSGLRKTKSNVLIESAKKNLVQNLFFLPLYQYLKISGKYIFICNKIKTLGKKKRKKKSQSSLFQTEFHIVSDKIQEYLHKGKKSNSEK